MKDAVDGVLCIRMPGQIIENFRRRRWQSWDRRAHIWVLSVISLLALDVPVLSAALNREEDCAPPPLA